LDGDLKCIVPGAAARRFATAVSPIAAWGQPDNSSRIPAFLC
jgi:hypothetical protein